MTIPSLTAIIPAPLAATKTGAPAVQTTATATDTQVQVPQPLANALDAVLAAARQSAAARQDGLSVLMANALRAVTANALPDAVLKAVDQLLALHMPTDTPPDAQSVKTALQTSGLFTEANLASGATRIPVDVKTALLQLNQAAQAWMTRAALAGDPRLEAAATQVAVVATPPAQRQAPAKKGTTPKAPDAASGATRSAAPQTPSASPRAVPESAIKTLAPVTAHPVALAQAVTARPVAPAQTAPASQSSEPLPEAFKPVMELLTQAVEALHPEAPQPVTPQRGQASPLPQSNASQKRQSDPRPQSASTAKATAAPQSPAPAPVNAAPAGVARSASLPALQQAQVKIAVTLIDQAVNLWPSPQAPQTATQARVMPFAVADSKIAAQAYATAQPEPAPMPPAIKAVLTQLEKTVEPYLVRQPRLSSHNNAPARVETVSPENSPPSNTRVAKAPDFGSTEPETTRPAPPSSATSTPDSSRPMRSTAMPAKSLAPPIPDAETPQTPVFVATPARAPTPTVSDVETAERQPVRPGASPAPSVPDTPPSVRTNPELAKSTAPRLPTSSGAAPQPAPPSATPAKSLAPSAPNLATPEQMSETPAKLSMPNSDAAAPQPARPGASPVKTPVPPTLDSEVAVPQPARTSATPVNSLATPEREPPIVPQPQDTTAVAPPANAPAPSTPSAKPAVPIELRTLLGMLNKLAECTPEASQAPPANAPEARPGTPSVPPPAAGSPSKAQSPAAPTLPEHADATLIAKSLATGSDAALARQTLLQIASLPDPVVQNRTGEARWIFDLPVMTDQGAAVAQVIIERDGRNATGDAPRPVWRVQFALNIEPLGPVRANVAISGEHAWVTIGAERPESLAKLQSQAASLSDGLQAESLEADIAFQSGAAPQSAGRGKPLVDRAS